MIIDRILFQAYGKDNIISGNEKDTINSSTFGPN